MPQLLTQTPQLGQIIKARRQALRLTQRALATKLAITQNRLSQIEADPSALTVARLLDLFNILGLDLLIQNRQPIKKDEW